MNKVELLQEFMTVISCRCPHYFIIVVVIITVIVISIFDS